MTASIADQPYFVTERQVTLEGQFSVAHHHVMSLCENEIVTHVRSFSLHEVYDLSYRKLGNREGILYLHTKQGVFPYQVKSDPAAFMDAFRSLTAGP